jgi:hypothetical protein
MRRKGRICVWTERKTKTNGNGATVMVHSEAEVAFSGRPTALASGTSLMDILVHDVICETLSVHTPSLPTTNVFLL